MRPPRGIMSALTMTGRSYQHIYRLHKHNVCHRADRDIPDFRETCSVVADDGGEERHGVRCSSLVVACCSWLRAAATPAVTPAAGLVWRCLATPSDPNTDKHRRLPVLGGAQFSQVHSLPP